MRLRPIGCSRVCPVTANHWTGSVSLASGPPPVGRSRRTNKSFDSVCFLVCESSTYTLCRGKVRNLLLLWGRDNLLFVNRIPVSAVACIRTSYLDDLEKKGRMDFRCSRLSCELGNQPALQLQAGHAARRTGGSGGEGRVPLLSCRSQPGVSRL